MARPKLQKHVLTGFDADKLQRAAGYLDGLNNELASEHARDLRKVEAKLRRESKRLLKDKGGARKSAWTTEAEERYGNNYIADNAKRNARARSVFTSLKSLPVVKKGHGASTKTKQWNQVRNHLKAHNDTLKKM